MNPPHSINLEGVAKRFGPVVALRDVTLSLAPGEVLGLVGDNGAGKSTLIKILSGLIRPDAGSVVVGGEAVELRSVSHARSLGIETVYQDLALVNELPVYQNMFLKREIVRRLGPFRIVNKSAMKRDARVHLSEMRVGVQSVEAKVARLSGGQRQAIAIARAVYSRATILLLDEPLAAMGAKEGGVVVELIRGLKDRGDVSMILIAHNYTHIFDLCDRVNVLQHGEIVLDKHTRETSMGEVTDVVSSGFRIGSGAETRPS